MSAIIKFNFQNKKKRNQSQFLEENNLTTEKVQLWMWQ